MKNIFIPFLFLLYILYCNNGLAQGENNVWAFGNGVGLDFNSGAPVVISSSIITNEGCASICDAAGNLLFYSDGQKVWDKTHSVMPNGSGILGSPALSATMGVAIVPLPLNPGQYFLFTLGGVDEPGFGNLYCSLIDMSLNSGKGDIVSGRKNLVIANGMSEKMIVGAGCGSVWLVTHNIDRPIFYVFKITGTTIPAPLKRVAGTIVKGGNYIIGEMKFSADHSKIAMGNYGGFGYFKSRIEIFDFDKINGEIKAYNPIDSINTYSIELSPDGSKLYCSFSDSGGFIYQYDLSALPDAGAVAATKVRIASGHFSIRRGPDNKIYMQSGITDMSIINKPNLAGITCDLDWRSPTITGLSKSGIGNLGNSTAVALAKETIVSSKWDTSLCELSKLRYAFKRNHHFFQWSDGDTSQTKTFLTSGKFWITSYKDCFIYIDTINVKYTPVDAVFTSRIDTTICGSSPFLYSAAPGHVNFKWDDGDTSRNRSFTNGGKFWISSQKDCSLYTDTINLTFYPADTQISKVDSVLCFAKEWIIKPKMIYEHLIWNDGVKDSVNRLFNSGIKWVISKDKYCKTYIDTFKAKFIDFTFNLKDTEICKNEVIILDASVNEAAQYLWQDGSIGKTYTAKQSGNYQVEVSVDGCKKQQEISIKNRLFELEFGEDKVLCEGDTINLEANINRANYLWQDGSANKKYSVFKNGTYSLKVSDGVCFTEDSIRIEFVKCSNCIAIPNAFTPNNDGKNDFFGPIIECPVVSYTLKIFNRYGQEVFTSNNLGDKWNGKYNNQDALTGVYYYLIKVQFDYPHSTEEMYKGDISLLR